MTTTVNTATFRQHIAGQWADAVDGDWIDSVDPYRGEVWSRIPRGNDKDVAAAVAAAKQAMTDGPWATMTPPKRAAIMRRIAAAIVDNAQRLAEVEVRDNGKLLSEVQGQLSASSECWYYYAGLTDKIEGSSIPLEKPNTVAFTTREPVGVVAALTAWNSPLWFVAVKCAPALAAGCSVVVKPSEFASASTLEFAGLLKEAGLPDGVFNVVTGYGQEVGAALVEHPDVAKITFTGAETTGTRIYEAAASSLKRVSLELGGKSPNIVFDDADLDLAATGVITGIFGAAGQMCAAGSRLLVHTAVKDAFVEKVIALAGQITLGDPMDPRTNVGPIATRPQYEKVLHYLNVAESDGARCVLGGRPADDPELKGGQFVEPTIYVDVDNSMRIAQEEVFGPILSVIEFDSEESAVQLANDVDYGLVAGVWTKDTARALRMSKALHVGTVWLNTYRTYSYMLPFGGMKRSGIGRENGIEAVSEYLETKSVVMSTDDSVPTNPFVIR